MLYRLAVRCMANPKKIKFRQLKYESSTDILQIALYLA